MSDTMISRSEYVAGNVSHDEYYGQFVTDALLQVVKSRFGEALQGSRDEHFNDIPLQRWDAVAEYLGDISPDIVRAIAKANGSGGISLSDKVCVLKRAAKRIRDGV